MLRRLLARLLPPRSYCSACARPFFSDVRRPCACGETARTFSRSIVDSFGLLEDSNAKKG